MDINDRIGRVFMIGLPGEPEPEKARVWLEEIRPGGLILFQRHCRTAEGTEHLLRELRESSGRSMLFAIDQEGGQVNRFADWLGPVPGARVLAIEGDEVARRTGRAVGRLLRSLGFNVDFAPVVDLSPGDRPNGIGDRAWSTDPECTTRRAGAFLDGLQAEGVAGCLKHFPGLGETFIDSHHSLPICRRSREQLECEELLPFRRLHENAAMVMVSHAAFPALDGDTPASLSQRIIEGQLRGNLGYRGLVVSDDMEMGALQASRGSGQEAVAALRAGCDLLIYGNRMGPARAAHQALLRECQADPGFAMRVSEAADRVDRACASWPVRAERDSVHAQRRWSEDIGTDRS